jgi:hypothetical protein
MSSLKPKEIDFNEKWSIVLGTVRSVISMGRFGHTDRATWQERFFGLINKIFVLINIIYLYRYILFMCRYTRFSF